MAIPPKIGIYVCFPVLWCGAIAFRARDTTAVFLGHWTALLIFPVLMCAAIYGVQRLRKRPLYWQRWFFWIGLVIPSFLRLGQTSN